LPRRAESLLRRGCAPRIQASGDARRNSAEAYAMRSQAFPCSVLFATLAALSGTPTAVLLPSL